MYATARQTSQGTQRCYTVSHTPQDDEANIHHNYINTNSNYINGDPTLLTLLTPRISRQNTNNLNTINLFSDFNDNISFQNPDELIHNLSSFEDAPYLTPTATRLMRDVSSDPNDFYVSP
jgi:hypothetical protein